MASNVRLPPVYQRVFITPLVEGQTTSLSSPVAGGYEGGNTTFRHYQAEFLQPVRAANVAAAKKNAPRRSSMSDYGHSHSSKPARSPATHRPVPPSTSKRSHSTRRRKPGVDSNGASGAVNGADAGNNSGAAAEAHESNAPLGAVASSTLEIVEDLRDLLTRPHSRTDGGTRRGVQDSPTVFIGETGSGVHQQADWRPIFAQSYAALQRASTALTALDEAGDAWEKRLGAATLEGDFLDGVDDEIHPPVQRPAPPKPPPKPKNDDSDEDADNEDDDAVASAAAPKETPKETEPEVDDAERAEAMALFGDAAIEMDRLLYDAEREMSDRERYLETGVDRALRSLCGWPAYKPGESKPPAESQEAAAPSPTRLAPEDHSTFLSAKSSSSFGDEAVAKANQADLVKGNFSSRMFQRDEFVAALEAGANALELEKRALVQVRRLERELREAKETYRLVSRWVDQGIRAEIDTYDAPEAPPGQESNLSEAADGDGDGVVVS